MNRRYKKLGNNILWISIGDFATKFLMFLMLPIYTYILTPDEYGYLELITSIMGILFPIVTLIISEAIFRFTLDSEYGNDEVFSTGMYITLIGILAAICIFPAFLFMNFFRVYLKYIILYFISDTFNQTLSYFLRGIDRVKINSIGGILNTVCFILNNLIFIVFFSLGLQGYMLSLVIANFVSVIFKILSVKINRYIVLPKKINKDLPCKMILYSLPMIPNSIGWWVNNSLDKLMLAQFVGVSATGLYAVAYKIPAAINMIMKIFVSAWQIASVEEFNSEESTKFYNEIYGQYSGISVVLSVFINMFILVIAYVMFSKEFYNAWKYVPFLVVGTIYSGLSGFLGTVFTAAKRTKNMLYSTLLGAVINFILNMYLITKIGILGAAVATQISFFTVWLVRYKMAQKILLLEEHYFLEDIFCFVLLSIQNIVLLRIERRLVFNIVVLILIVYVKKRFIFNAFKKIKEKINSS